EAEIGGAFFETKAKRCNLHTKVKRDDAQMCDGKALARLFQACAQTQSEARSHFIGALALLAEQIERAAETRTRGESVDSAAEHQNSVAHLLGERAAQVGDVLIEFSARLHDEFRGGGRGGSANVSHKIGDGEVGFVADAGDHGNL